MGHISPHWLLTIFCDFLAMSFWNFVAKYAGAPLKKLLITLPFPHFLRHSLLLLIFLKPQSVLSYGIAPIKQSRVTQIARGIRTQWGWRRRTPPPPPPLLASYPMCPEKRDRIVKREPGIARTSFLRCSFDEDGWKWVGCLRNKWGALKAVSFVLMESAFGRTQFPDCFLWGRFLGLTHVVWIRGAAGSAQNKWHWMAASYYVLKLSAVTLRF